MHTSTLLENLMADVRAIILEANAVSQLPASVLQQQPAPGSWSAIQVLAHLNFYSRHYNTAIEAGLHRHTTTPSATYKPGWLGNYFTGMMMPGKDSRIGNKMSAPKTAIPAPMPPTDATLQEFLQHQHHLLTLLQLAATAHLGNIRIPTSLSSFITLKLGDTFRFVVAHEQRHFVQLAAVLRQVHQ